MMMANDRVRFGPDGELVLQIDYPPGKICWEGRFFDLAHYLVRCQARNVEGRLRHYVVCGIPIEVVHRYEQETGLQWERLGEKLMRVLIDLIVARGAAPIRINFWLSFECGLMERQEESGVKDSWVEKEWNPEFRSAHLASEPFDSLIARLEEEVRRVQQDRRLVKGFAVV